MLQVDFSNKFLPSKMSFFSYHNFMNDCQDDKIAGNSTFAISNPVNIYLRWFFLKSINIKISLTLNFLLQIHKQKLGTHNPESCYFKKPIPDNNFLKEKLIYLLPKLSLEVLTIACIPTCINVENLLIQLLHTYLAIKSLKSSDHRSGFANWGWGFL